VIGDWWRARGLAVVGDLRVLDGAGDLLVRPGGIAFGGARLPNYRGHSAGPDVLREGLIG
jgi:hypothetical protein